MNNPEKYLQFGPVGKFKATTCSLFVGAVLAMIAFALPVVLGPWAVLLGIPLAMYAGLVISLSLSEILEDRRK